MKVGQHSQFPPRTRVLFCTLIFVISGCISSESENANNGVPNASQQPDRDDTNLSEVRIVTEQPAGEADRAMLRECQAINVLTVVLFHRRLEEKLGALGPVLNYCGSLRSGGGAQQLHAGGDSSRNIVFMTKAGQRLNGDYSSELMWELSLRGERLCRVWLTTAADDHVACRANIAGLVVNVCVKDIPDDATLDDLQDSLGGLSVRKFLESLGDKTKQ